MNALLVELLQVAQGPPNGIDAPIRTGTGLVASAVWTFLVTVILGGILVAIAPEYTRARMADVGANPVGNFLFGLVALVLVIVVAVIFAITIIGIPIAMLLGLVAYLLWIFGAIIAYLAIADRLIGPRNQFLGLLLLAGAINGILVLTGIGSIISFIVGATGFGTVVRKLVG